MKTEGPDFICVGLARAGTGWLYDQTISHPDFWMPPYKELRYFGSKFPSPKMRDDLLVLRRRIRSGGSRLKGSTAPPMDARDAGFVDRALAMVGAEANLDAYAALFSPKGDLLSGDISPNYAFLDEDVVGTIAARFPRAKILLMLRDPVERAWSHWRMHNRARASRPDDAGAFRTFIERAQTTERWSPTVAAQLWGSAFGERYRHVFLDDVALSPDRTRAEILSFIGADPARSSPLGADHNRKRQPTLPRPPEIQELMRAAFADERRRCAETFGGAALAWADAPY